MSRKSPKESATLFKEGVIMEGKHSKYFVIKKTAQGVKRWVPYVSAELFGFRVARESDISKTKPTVLYERGYLDTWPKTTRGMTKVIFRPASGVYKRGISGYIKYPKTEEFFGGLLVNPTTKQVSTNLLNTEAFIKL